MNYIVTVNRNLKCPISQDSPVKELLFEGQRTFNNILSAKNYYYQLLAYLIYKRAYVSYIQLAEYETCGCRIEITKCILCQNISKNTTENHTSDIPNITDYNLTLSANSQSDIEILDVVSSRLLVLSNSTTSFENYLGNFEINGDVVTFTSKDVIGNVTIPLIVVDIISGDFIEFNLNVEVI